MALLYHCNNNLTISIFYNAYSYTKKKYVTKIEAINLSSEISANSDIKIEKVKITYNDNSEEELNSEDVIWFSSDNSILEANGGKLVSKEKGTAQVTIKSGIAEKVYDITVK